MHNFPLCKVRLCTAFKLIYNDIMSKIKNNAPGEYYHVFNRGMQKQRIFENDSDRIRFLFLLLALQGKNSIKNMSREVKRNTKESSLHILPELKTDILKERTVELLSFCLMPNHFHLLLKEISEGGISKYMQRVTTAYTKYFNARHQKSGHLLQSSYKCVHIEDDLQLMHVSAYIHKNAIELTGWREKYMDYPWSSLKDYVSKNRFSDLLSTDLILEHYDKINRNSEYMEFVKTSLAKEAI